MNEVKFNSQICTTIEQSQRLLKLGLKPETADCFHWNYSGVNYVGNITEELETTDVPAWSLHRLMEIAEVSVEVSGIFVRISSTYYYEEKDNVYDNLIDAISELINNEVFNKEYLKQ